MVITTVSRLMASGLYFWINEHNRLSVVDYTHDHYCIYLLGKFTVHRLQGNRDEGVRYENKKLQNRFKDKK
jgi:hypothetical protein